MAIYNIPSYSWLLERPGWGQGPCARPFLPLCSSGKAPISKSTISVYILCKHCLRLNNPISRASPLALSMQCHLSSQTGQLFCIIFAHTFNYRTSTLCLIFSYSLYSTSFNPKNCDRLKNLMSASKYSNRSVSYKEQAAFSFSSYPFSMKLLWAPLVDSLYVARWL